MLCFYDIDDDILTAILVFVFSQMTCFSYDEMQKLLREGMNGIFSRAFIPFFSFQRDYSTLVLAISIYFFIKLGPVILTHTCNIGSTRLTKSMCTANRLIL